VKADVRVGKGKAEIEKCSLRERKNQESLTGSLGTSSVAAKHRTYGPLRQRSSFSTLPRVPKLACTNKADNRFVGNK